MARRMGQMEIAGHWRGQLWRNFGVYFQGGIWGDMVAETNTGHPKLKKGFLQLIAWLPSRVYGKGASQGRQEAATSQAAAATTASLPSFCPFILHPGCKSTDWCHPYPGWGTQHHSLNPPSHTLIITFKSPLYDHLKLWGTSRYKPEHMVKG